MGRAEAEQWPSGWADELACLFRRLRMTSGADPSTRKPLSLRQIAKRSGYVPSGPACKFVGDGSCYQAVGSLR
jgi:hypothetical protein